METIASITFVPNLSHPYIELMIYPDFAEEIVYDPSMNEKDNDNGLSMDDIEVFDWADALLDADSKKESTYEVISYDDWYKDEDGNICCTKKTVKHKKGTPVPKSKFKCVPKKRC